MENTGAQAPSKLALNPPEALDHHVGGLQDMT